MKMAPDETFDKLETMLLLAMDATVDDDKTKRNMASGKYINEEVNINAVLKIPPMKPSSSYISVPTDLRYYTADPSMLLDHPAEIFGGKSEILLLDEKSDLLKWVGVRRLPKAPVGCVAVSPVSHWYEFHYRTITLDGAQNYHVSPVPLSKKGVSVPYKCYGNMLNTDPTSRFSVVLAASLIEDAYSANTMLASVKDTVEFKFPVPLNAYKELFALRDGPYSGSRRKAILHWVSKHLRRKQDNDKVEVKEHLRGVHEFTVDGLNIKLEANRKVTVVCEQ